MCSSTLKKGKVLTVELNDIQKQEIKDIYQSCFKGASIDFWEYKDGNYMWIKFYLAADTKELPHGYWENDCFHIRFEVRKIGDTFILKAEEKSYLIKPIYNTWLAYDRRDIPFRKAEGDWGKITESLKRFVQRLCDQFKDDLKAEIVKEQHAIPGRKRLGLCA